MKNKPYNELNNKNINKKDFEEARKKVIGVIKEQNGIGTLKEKTVHSVMKYFFILSAGTAAISFCCVPPVSIPMYLPCIS